MPTASVVVPAFNVAKTLPATLEALLAQSFEDMEIIIVDDGSTDDTAQIAAQFASSPRIRVVTQANRGLAGARNTGIAAARGIYVGFCDADDLWVPHKLATHVAHLECAPDVGISYSGSELVDDDGQPTGVSQRPALQGITAARVFKRNPIGNGSAAVFRKAALDAIAYRPGFETQRNWVFDETFRQSEDIECWMRLALTTDWLFEGVPGLLTQYRVNAGGLSAALDRQLASWERMVTKLRPLHPTFFDQHEDAARAYQYRYLARRAVSSRDGKNAWALATRACVTSRRPLIEEPLKTIVTLAASAVLKALGPAPISYASRLLAR
ncbi:glycosyltransferase [Marivita sp. S6314]|uniref:glycosyltransferase family 2 protein n=1 Tax=Marivita sp. S6314 TaxID=2926406 RepID=UPI001FF29F56|nr:glycosyltransferase family 2 protein [Marivita sp. S6314]MCK0149480.1 glycosyltransferase [Marivita sp. S6314]